MAGEEPTSGPDWLQPPAEQEGLSRYVEVVRERILLIAVAVVLTLGAAVLYLLSAGKVYESGADLLVTPASDNDPVLVSLGAIRESADPTRDVETAAHLATTIEVAERVRRKLDVQASPQELLSDVSAEPVAQSNIVAVTGQAGTAREAQRLANAFAGAAVEQRTAELHDQIDMVLPRLRARARSGPDESAGLGEEIARLETLRSAPDPTLRVETEAPLPSSAISPRPALTVVAALVAGLVLGTGVAFASQQLDPVLRREAQLRSRYRLPILARIPGEPGRHSGQPLTPQTLSPMAQEAFRTLRASVIAARRHRQRGEALLITGSAPSEGKTTTAINLGVALSLAGHRTILIEADLRRPSIARTLGVGADRGIVSVLLENTTLEESLHTVPSIGANLEVLPADYEGGWIAELFSLPAAKRLIDEAKQRAEYVLIDSPPLTTVIDALPLASGADDVLLVTRLGHTRLDRLEELGELMATNDLKPLGFAILGAPRPEDGSYYRERTLQGGDGGRGKRTRGPLAVLRK